MGINFEALQQVRDRKIQEYLIRDNATGSKPYIIGEVQHEVVGHNDFNFIYFESKCEGCSPNMKRYHMLVFSPLYFDCYYGTSNVIDGSKSYGIADIKVWFKNYLTSLLHTLQESLSLTDEAS